MKQIREDPPPLRSLRAGIPRSLESVVLKALAKDPDERDQTADAMGSSLRAIGSGSSTAVIPSPSSERAAPARPTGSGTDMRWVWPLAGIIVVVVVLAVLLPRLIGEPTCLPEHSPR